MTIHAIAAAALVMLSAANYAGAQPSSDVSEYGPARGTLVIQGGGSSHGTGIQETFINRAGGLNAKIVVVPTAGGNKNPDGQVKVYK
jgi:cyanophycinase